MFTRGRVFGLACLVLFAAGSAWAQNGDVTQPPVNPDEPHAQPSADAGFPSTPASVTGGEEGKIKFSSQTILVQAPVIVTDKAGNHVHGLTKQNFHIFENGKEQKVATFEEIVASDQQLPVIPPRPGEFTNLTLSDQHPRSITVIALDMLNTPFLSQANSRHELVRYLADNIDSKQVLALMIITSRGVKVVQGLTGDREQLIQLLKKTGGDLTAMLGLGPDTQANAAVGDVPELPTNLSRPFVAAAQATAHGDTLSAQVLQQQAIEQTLNGFLEIAWFLSGVPGRKSLIWATGGFPFEISTAAQLPGGYLSPLYERTMQALDAAQISVYPIDARGLVGTDSSAAVVSSTGPELAHQVANRTQFQQSLIDTLNEFADITGGKAFYNTNDLASSFKRAADDGTSYYLVGYYLDTHNRNSGWRGLKVKLDRKDLDVRSREGFFVTKATMDLEATRTSDLNFALTSPIEGTGVPLSVKWLGTSGEGAKRKSDFIIHMPPGGVSIAGSNGQKRLNFEFAASAYASDGKTGKAVVTIDRSVNLTVPESQIATVMANGIDMKNVLELSPGQYVVRIVIRDNVTGKIGSVTAPLTVN